jgi:hypothetical protein
MIRPQLCDCRRSGWVHNFRDFSTSWPLIATAQLVPAISWLRTRAWLHPPPGHPDISRSQPLKSRKGKSSPRYHRDYPGTRTAEDCKELLTSRVPTFQRNRIRFKRHALPTCGLLVAPEAHSDQISLQKMHLQTPSETVQTFDMGCV